jgi:hypothetical protein
MGILYENGKEGLTEYKNIWKNSYDINRHLRTERES